MVKWKTLPFPSSLSAQIVPPKRSTISLEIDSPSPDPAGPPIAAFLICLNLIKMSYLLFTSACLFLIIIKLY